MIITNDKTKLPEYLFERKIKMKLKMARPYIKIKGKRSIWILLDTGYADGHININRESAFLDNELIAIKNKTQLVSSLNSTKQMDISYYMQKTTIGDFSTLQPIVVSDLKSSRIGSKILQENHVIIDAVHNSLYVLPVPKEDAEFLMANIGFNFENGNVSVASLVKKSVFGNAGIKLRDTIMQLNEFKVSDIKDYCEYKEVFKRLKFPLTVVFKNKKGQDEIICTKEQYYE